SILRSHREVFYGEIPYWKSAGPNWPAFEDIDRWWGCEIHFEPALDRAFSVKNIKRGAVPERELKEVIKSRITGSRQEVLRRVRELWDANKQQEKLEKEREKNEGVVRPGPDHSVAEAVAKKTPTGKTKADKDKDRDQEADRAAEAMGDAYSEDERQKLAEIFRSQPFTLQNDSWKGDDFFDTQQLGGSAVLKYNEKHRFVEHLNLLLGRLGALEESPQAIEIAKELRVMIDLLVMSFARAEQQVDLDEGEVHPEITLENLNGDWGRFLKSFVRTFLDEMNVESGQ
ncbi:hypothetical protein N9226_00655, partial [bacterium]|nr:hypothetical protein [bacterium]